MCDENSDPKDIWDYIVICKSIVDIKHIQIISGVWNIRAKIPWKMR